MKISFYVEIEDVYILKQFLEDYEEDDATPIYYTNKPASPTQVMISLDFRSFNELIDMELLRAL